MTPPALANFDTGETAIVHASCVALSGRALLIVGASALVTPVVEIDGKPVGSGKVGELVPRIREIYLEEMRKAAV